MPAASHLADDALSAAFAALADPTRRAILARLAQGHTHVGELAQPFAISAPAISRHLKVLQEAGLIEREVDARWRICHLRPQGLQAAHDWLAQYRAYWEASLDRLAELLENQPTPAPRRGTASTPTPPPVRRRPLKRKPR
ncbi:ArsR/SmtB family transcription factor [Ideonella sp. YS5]|uniref:ArsR/SmtB family transcription factor n=1 Tax=Ideonella sp. YS5 TaxID=3453714 RepID=UPI003EE961F1